MWGIITEQDEERSRLTLVWKKETRSWKSPCLPLPPPVAGMRRHTSLVPNTPELSRPFPLCGVAEQTSPSNL